MENFNALGSNHKFSNSEIGTTSLQGEKLLPPKCPLFGGSIVFVSLSQGSGAEEACNGAGGGGQEEESPGGETTDPETGDRAVQDGHQSTQNLCTELKQPSPPRHSC